MSEISRNSSGIVVKPGKDIVASMANEFRSELYNLVQEGPKELIVDLEGVAIIDSVGIGVMIATHNSLNKVGGKLKIIHAEKNIYDLFSTMRLNRHFTVEGDG
ncbi:MAG: STAS domain-containing protein [Thermodesulfobacteriota bacterium]